jgi:tRNA threonylcarbamoyl adenosine modification protein YeaZ
MLSLGIDTSTRTGYVALVQDDHLLLEETVDAELDHSASLLPAIRSALERSRLSLSDLDCVGVGLGPGSLTGVRVGIAFAKGLVFAIRKPLVGVSSLEAIAHRRRNSPGSISVVVDAKMGGFYCASYRCCEASVEQVSPLRVVNHEELPRTLAPGSLVLSPDAEAIPPRLAARFPAGCEMEAAPVFPSAEYVARRAILEVEAEHFDPNRMVEPIYLRPGVPRKPKPP